MPEPTTPHDSAVPQCLDEGPRASTDCMFSKPSTLESRCIPSSFMPERQDENPRTSKKRKACQQLTPDSSSLMPECLDN